LEILAEREPVEMQIVLAPSLVVRQSTAKAAARANELANGNIFGKAS